MSKRLLTFVVVLVTFAFAGVGNAFGATLVVDDDGFASPANCGALTPATSTSVEGGVEAANPGDTVNVCPGTYTEQVSFDSDDGNITIRSVVGRAAIIEAPMTIALDVVTEKSIVSVTTATGVRILGFTITGPGPFGCDSIRFGVLVRGGGSATIDDNHIALIRDTPFSGCQNGVGIQVGRMILGQTGSATITRNLIDGYQKNGMTIDNTGSSATVVDNDVRGIGPTPIIAQNGIQVSRGATASVRDNRIADNTYSLAPAFGSAGILVFQGGTSPITIAENRVMRNDDNIGVYASSAVQILRNAILDSTFFDGIFMNADTASNRIEDNFLRGNFEHDCHDDSVGPYPGGVANLWIDNDGLTDNRGGSLCEIDDDEDDDDDDGDDDDGDDDDDDDRGDED